MQIKLNIETTFSLEKGSDLFIFISTENHDEVDYEGITFDEILARTFLEIKNPEERLEVIEKIRAAVNRFQETMNTEEKTILGNKNS